MRKGIARADVERTLDAVKGIPGLHVGYNFFLAYPGTGLRDMIEAIIMYFKVILNLLGRASACVGWVRLEPHTHAYDLAREEGFIDETVDLLPQDEEGLYKLFYVRRAFLPLDLLVLGMTRFVERVVRPLSKKFLWRRRAPKPGTKPTTPENGGKR